MLQPFKINWTCNLTSLSSDIFGCNSDGSSGPEYLEKLQTFTIVVILTRDVCRWNTIDTAKNTFAVIVIQKVCWQLWVQVHYFNEDSLEKRHNRIISATDTSCQKSDANHLLVFTSVMVKYHK